MCGPRRPARRRTVGGSIFGQALVDPSPHILFVEDDPEHFALRCVDILRDPSMRREMGERARKFADAYEWAKIRRRMMEVVYSDERDSVEHHLIRA